MRDDDDAGADAPLDDRRPSAVFIDGRTHRCVRRTMRMVGGGAAWTDARSSLSSRSDRERNVCEGSRKWFLSQRNSFCELTRKKFVPLAPTDLGLDERVPRVRARSHLLVELLLLLAVGLDVAERGEDDILDGFDLMTLTEVAAAATVASTTAA